MKLLLAIDFSQFSSKVIDAIAARPWPAKSEACILHVLDWQELPMNAAVTQEMKESAKRLVMSACTKLSNSGLPATTAIIEGHPRTAIADYAKEWGADFVFVGSRGAGGVARFLLGSVAQATLRRSPCSVEIVREAREQGVPASRGLKMLLATDGSACSMAAITSVAQRPWPAGSQIRVVSVIPVIVPLAQTVAIAPTYYPSSVLYDELVKISRERAESAVVPAQEILRDAGIPVEPEFPLVGDPREIILDEAKNWGTDLIVLGSHGHRGIDRLMLGSVSESVAIHAHCSVEVIREAAPRA